MPAATPTDWDEAVEVFKRVRRRKPRLAKRLAGRAYRASAPAAWIKDHRTWPLEETTGKRVGRTRFESVKWRGIGEWTFIWFARDRRLSNDDEHNPASKEMWITIAMIHRRPRFSRPDRETDDDLMQRPSKTFKDVVFWTDRGL